MLCHASRNPFAEARVAVAASTIAGTDPQATLSSWAATSPLSSGASPRGDAEVSQPGHHVLDRRAPAPRPRIRRSSRRLGDGTGGLPQQRQRVDDARRASGLSFHATSTLEIGPATGRAGDQQRPADLHHQIRRIGGRERIANTPRCAAADHESAARAC